MTAAVTLAPDRLYDEYLTELARVRALPLRAAQWVPVNQHQPDAMHSQAAQGSAYRIKGWCR